MAPKRPTPRAKENAPAKANHQRPTPTPALPKLTSEAAEVLQLQRTVGNQAVIRRLGASQPLAPASGASRTRIQAKLTVGPANDPYERQADAMADLVLRQSASAAPALLTDNDQHARRAPASLGVLEMEPEEEQPEQPGGQSVGPQSGTGTPPDEDKTTVQRKASAAEGGFEVSGAFEARLRARRGQGSPLPAATRARLEPGFGADFRPVRVHADAEAARLSRSVSAQAFTHGTDIYMGAGKYNPASSSGQRLLAHELTHVVQQAGPAVRRKGAAQLPAAAALSLARQAQRSFDIQRAFMPVTTTAKTHLRATAGAGVDVDTKIGRNIPSGEEIVVDTAQTVVQTRKIISNVTWARAVDVRPAAWNPANDKTAGGYIRFLKMQPPNAVYTETVDLPSRVAIRADRRFHEDVGSYLDVEESISRPGNRIIKQGNVLSSLSATNQVLPLDAPEKLQTGVTTEITARLDVMLRQVALAKHIDPTLLVTTDIKNKLAKPLRALTMDRRQMVQWAGWTGGVFTRIRQGVEQLCDALNHWKTWLDTGNTGGVVLQELQLFGSDLHERGIGAVKVRFTKPINAHPMFPGASVTAVLKQDDREAEKQLLGAQPTSLASQLNQRYGATAGDMNLLPTIKMETHNTHGAFIEFVQGTPAEQLGGGEPVSQSMIEAISFSMITGLGDLHKENILWNNGKPFLIDADNVLLNRMLTPPVDTAGHDAAVKQTGFTHYNQASQQMTEDLHNNPGASRSLIIQEMMRDARPLIAAVKAALQGRKGRVVPIKTAKWADWLGGYSTRPDGPINDNTFDTRNGLAAIATRLLPNPNPGGPMKTALGPGLEGETGIAGAGRHYANAAAKTQIKADFDKGQIPFYNYEFSTGHVLHNNQDIWHGQTLDEAMNVLLAKFPVPRTVTV